MRKLKFGKMVLRKNEKGSQLKWEFCNYLLYWQTFTTKYKKFEYVSQLIRPYRNQTNSQYCAIVCGVHRANPAKSGKLSNHQKMERISKKTDRQIEKLKEFKRKQKDR
jgi:hypothetical protein